ncbi:unnamed protein product [Camellia sinensis]
MGDKKSRIDRALVNYVWQDYFPESEAASDHCSVIVTIWPNCVRKRPFKFFNFWMANSKFDDILIGVSFGMFILC